MNDRAHCLCGTGQAYALCCQPYHLNSKQPLTAELLMRARFTAYALQNEAYLLQTWAIIKRPTRIDFSKEHAKWTALTLVKIKKGGAKDSKGVVEFKAYYLQEGEEYVMHEISRFKKSTGGWLYLEGVVKSVVKVGQSTNQGKNAPCECGSGKKYKRCCGK